MKSTKNILWIGLGCLSLTACGPASLSFRMPASFLSIADGAPPKVCNPFGGGDGSVTTERNGIAGELYFLLNQGNNATYVDDYLTKGTKMNVDVRLSTLNVPTRAFALGFGLDDGRVLSDENGKILDEHFALDLRTQLILTPDQEEGDYELALISDDGSILDAFDLDSNGESIIGNDGTHPTKMVCGKRVVTMKHKSALPIRIRYFQGPRYHISLILLWRKVGSGRSPEPECKSVVSNDYFFDWQNKSPSVAKQSYLDLTNPSKGGWSTPKATNYLLPGKLVNDCK